MGDTPLQRGSGTEIGTVGTSGWPSSAAARPFPAAAAPYRDGRPGPEDRAGQAPLRIAIRVWRRLPRHGPSRGVTRPRPVPGRGDSDTNYLSLLGFVAGTSLGLPRPGAWAGLPDGNRPGGKLPDEGAMRSFPDVEAVPRFGL